MIDVIYIASGVFLQELAYRAGYKKYGRILWSALGFYLGHLSIPFMIFLWIRKIKSENK